MLMIDIPETEYIIFEHGPFNYEQENCSVEEKEWLWQLLITLVMVTVLILLLEESCTFIITQSSILSTLDLLKKCNPIHCKIQTK